MKRIAILNLQIETNSFQKWAIGGKGDGPFDQLDDMDMG
jgi:hypothetical protein